MIHLILGRQGSGKTLMLVKLAEDYLKRGKSIYSNVHLNFKYNKLKYDDIINCRLNDCIVILDEIHLLLSARRSLSKLNQEICDNFLSMARKQNTEIYGTTQTARKVDIRYREEADYIYKCTKYVWDFKKNIWLEVLHTYPFPKQYPIMIDITAEETYSGIAKNMFFIANDYFDKYDTRQIVRVEGLPEKFKKHKGVGSHSSQG